MKSQFLLNGGHILSRLCLLFFMLFKGSISEGYGQKIKFTLIDTLTLNLSSETFSGHIVTFSRDSLFYYMDEGEPQRNGGKYLTLNVVDCNSKIRKNIFPPCRFCNI